MRPTQRAPDVWESARFSSIFLASSFSCSQAESTPTHTQVTQTVGRQSKNQKQTVFESRVSLFIELEKENSPFEFGHLFSSGFGGFLFLVHFGSDFQLSSL
jgi:hypothetical protein